MRHRRRVSPREGVRLDGQHRGASLAFGATFPARVPSHDGAHQEGVLKRLSGLNKPLKYVGARRRRGGAAALSRSERAERALTTQTTQCPRTYCKESAPALCPRSLRCGNHTQTVRCCAFGGRSHAADAQVATCRAGKVCVVWESGAVQAVVTVFYVTM